MSGTTSTSGLKVHTSPSSFETKTTFQGEALFQNQVNVSAPEDPSTMVALQRKAPGELQIAPAGVDQLTIETTTTFTGTGNTTVFNGSAQVDNVLSVLETLAAQGDITVGSAENGWLLEAGVDGIQHTAGDNNDYQSVIRVNGGSTVDINPNGFTTGFVGGTQVFGPLFAKGLTTFEAGVSVNDEQNDVALFNKDQARFYKEALFDDGATVMVSVDGDAKEALKVSAAGVSLGLNEPGTVTSVSGIFQANGAATFQLGLGGAGLLAVKAATDTCVTTTELCDTGYVSFGSQMTGGQLANKCCKLELQ